MAEHSDEDPLIRWLLGRDQPAVRYFTLVDLLGYPSSSPEAKSTHAQIARRGWAKEILGEQEKGGYWESRKSLYQPKFTATNWRMQVLTDLGLTATSVKVKRGCGLFFTEWLKDGTSVVDEDEGEICVVGNLARVLARAGYGDDPRVKALFEWIVENQKDDGGWHCFKSVTGTLDCWEGLAAYAALPRGAWTRSIKRSAERGAEFYLERHLTEEGPRYAPWFRLHYPNHYYYDILVGLDVITALGHAGDKRLEPALKVLRGKRSPDGTWQVEAELPDLARGAHFRPEQERMKQPLKRFQLEDVGRPSKWMTLKSLRVLKRVAE